MSKSYFLPLPTVAIFPKTSVCFGLSKTETKHYSMLIQALKNNDPVTVSFTESPEKNTLIPQKVGVICHVSQDEEHPELFVLTGLARVKILGIVDTHPFIIVDYELYTENKTLMYDVDSIQKLKASVADFIGTDVLSDITDLDQIINSSCLFVQSSDNKQLLLETDSLQTRFDMIMLLAENKMRYIENKFLKKFFGDRVSPNSIIH